MIIAIAIFAFFFSITQSIIYSVLANINDVYDILTVLIFSSLLLGFIKEIRRYAWISFGGSILLYVTMNVLANSPNSVIWFLSIILTVPLTIRVKRFIWRQIRIDDNRPIEEGGPQFSPTLRLLLLLI